MCFPCAAAANLEKFKKQLGELFLSLPAKPLQDLASAETIKAYTAGAALTMPAKKNMQMEILRSVGPTRPDYFFGPGKGNVTCEPHQASPEQMKFHGKTLPIRILKVYWMKPAEKFDQGIGKFELLHADSFSCS